MLPPLGSRYFRGQPPSTGGSAVVAAAAVAGFAVAGAAGFAVAGAAGLAVAGAVGFGGAWAAGAAVGFCWTAESVGPRRLSAATMAVARCGRVASVIIPVLVIAVLSCRHPRQVTR